MHLVRKGRAESSCNGLAGVVNKAMNQIEFSIARRFRGAPPPLGFYVVCFVDATCITIGKQEAQSVASLMIKSMN
jgi:hypothetical protein